MSRTVILRLAGPAVDGHLHGVVEVVGSDQVLAFSDDTALLALLHEVEAWSADGAGPT